MPDKQQPKDGDYVVINHPVTGYAVARWPDKGTPLDSGDFPNVNAARVSACTRADGDPNAAAWDEVSQEVYSQIDCAGAWTTKQG